MTSPRGRACPARWVADMENTELNLAGGAGCSGLGSWVGGVELARLDSDLRLGIKVLGPGHPGGAQLPGGVATGEEPEPHGAKGALRVRRPRPRPTGESSPGGEAAGVSDGVSSGGHCRAALRNAPSAPRSPLPPPRAGRPSPAAAASGFRRGLRAGGASRARGPGAGWSARRGGTARYPGPGLGSGRGRAFQSARRAAAGRGGPGAEDPGFAHAAAPGARQGSPADPGCPPALGAQRPRGLRRGRRPGRP